jgi:hypothetical protein
MLGQTNYARVPRDFYATPARAIEAFVKVKHDLFAGRIVAEPACGDGAICRVIAPHVRQLVSTDIHAYEGYDPDTLVDFLKVRDLDDYAEQAGAKPTGMITNPPYGDLAEAFAWKAIAVMEPVGGWCALLCRHEWDAAKGRAPLFDHPAFAAKITLRFRPRWIEGTTGAPRFSYAWYLWDWSKDPKAPPAALYSE